MRTNPGQFLFVTVLLAGFVVHLECSFFDGYVPTFLEKFIPRVFRGPTGSSEEEDSCEGGEEDLPVQKRKIEHSICEKLYGESDGWCTKCGARGAITDGLDSLRQILPWTPNLSCLARSFGNYELYNKLLKGIEALVMPCKNKLPTRAQCRANATFEGSLREGDYVPPKDWPCLQKALTAGQFYVELQKLYKLVNPCIPKCPALDLEGREPSELKNDDNVSLWVHAIWWLWWYFLSGQVTFSLARRNKPDLISTVYDDVLFGNTFNPKAPTKIIVHGFVNNHRSSLLSLIRQAQYTSKNPKKRERIVHLVQSCRQDGGCNGGVAHPWVHVDGEMRGRVAGEVNMDLNVEMELEVPNIILVNWASMSYELYMMTRLRILMVARQILSLLQRLQVDFDVNLDSVEIIGHSLGAQISGIIGHLNADPEEHASRSLGQRKIGRITGLDPSLPGFLLTPKKWRLTKDSAKFVQAIHTSDHTFSSAKRAGHVDFYVNGGLPTQPGCGAAGILGLDVRKWFGKLGRGISQLGAGNFDILCSHFRGIAYYVESIKRPRAFLARKCDNVIKFSTGLCDRNPTTYMGARSPRKATPGSYYLFTAAKTPFGLGKKGI